MAESAYSSKARSSISKHIRKHKKEGMPQRQAVAAAMSEQRRKGRKVPSRKGKAKTSKRSRGGSKSKKAKAGRKGGKAKARKSR